MPAGARWRVRVDHLRGTIRLPTAPNLIAVSTYAAPTSDATSPDEADLTVADIAWNLSTLIEGTDIDAC